MWSLGCAVQSIVWLKLNQWLVWVLEYQVSLVLKEIGLYKQHGMRLVGSVCDVCSVNDVVFVVGVVAC